MKELEYQSLSKRFLDEFGGETHEMRMFHAPGRINLIGEHTDYNGGYVFPAALTFGTTMLIRPRKDSVIRFVSTNFPLKGSFHTSEMVFRKEDGWMNYPKGMLHHLNLTGFEFGGFDVLYHGTIPNGAGLSSSASIEVVTGFGFLTMQGIDSDRTQLALTAQKAENQFIGVNCGIMDQFTVSNGKAGHAVLLQCDTLEYELVPIDLQHYRIVIANTNKQRGLVDSEYNTRRAQCEQAVQVLQTVFPKLKTLGELTLEQFIQHKEMIQQLDIRKRTAHVISENDRVIRSVHALQDGDLQSFGRRMLESHASLRDDFEVSCYELDVLVDVAMAIEGVLGSRMTGAGFGGCTISLVPNEQIDFFQKQVGARYEELTGLKADFYVAEIGDGVREVTYQ